LSPWVPYVDILEGLATGCLTSTLDMKPLSLHLKLENLGLAYCDGAMQKVYGTLSYHAGLGAKWDFQGLGKSHSELFPFFCQGKGFFKTGWLQSEIRFEEAYCKISGDVNQ